jgi:hypothetical protein
MLVSSTVSPLFPLCPQRLRGFFHIYNLTLAEASTSKLFLIRYPLVTPIGSLLSLPLIEALEALYPPRPPSLKDSDREVWFKAGQYSVVEVLRAKFDEANESFQDILP